MIDFQKLHAQFELANPGFDFSKSQHGNYISKGTQESFTAWDRNNLVRKLRVNITDLKTRITALEAQLAAVQKDAAWIPVSERLPDTGGLVLLCGLRDGSPAIGIGSCHHGFIYRPEHFVSCSVTHWMHLPKPPIAGEATEQPLKSGGLANE